MNDLQIFDNAEFGQIRTATIDNKPWFVASDVANALGYSNSRDAIARHCKGVAKHDTPTSSGTQSISYINEGDVYRLIMKSKLPSAERFESWVMDEVLPSIRETGGYSVPQTTAGQIQLLAKGYTELEQQIANVNKNLQEFKQDMPLLAVECERITKAVRTKGFDVLGGKLSGAYNDKSLRSRVYKDIHDEVKRQFGVNTYKAIKRSQCDKAVEIIQNYNLPFALAEEVKGCNAQITMKEVI